MSLNPLPVAPASDVANPIFIVQIPTHGFPNPGFKRFFRTPTQFAFDLVCVHCISPIVPRAVFHKGDQLAVAFPGPRRHLVQNAANHFHDLDVPFFVPAANIVSFAHPPLRQHGGDSLAVVFHVEPVPHVLPIAVNRQRFSVSRIEDH